MPIYRLIEEQEYKLGIWKIEEDETELVRMSGICPPSGINGTARRREYLAIRVLALQMGIPPSSIGYESSGKPVLKSPPTDSFQSISLSHTKNFAVVMLGQHPDIGVDIEEPAGRILKVREKFMHPLEEKALLDWLSKCAEWTDSWHVRLKNSQLTDEMLGLLLHWCAKETMFKAVPDDGIDFREELRVVDFHPRTPYGQFRTSYLRSGASYDMDFRIEEEFILTCSCGARSR